MKYKVLTNKNEGYELAVCSGRTVKALRLLQVRSSYYTDVIRYAIAKEQCFKHVITSEQVSETSINFDIVEADMGADEFLDEVAKLLFPYPEVIDNIEDIDYVEVGGGLEAFLNFIEPRHRKQNDLLSSLIASPVEMTGTTKTETEAEGQLTKMPTQETLGNQ